jgi:FtsP/CotA-like multicopper oxidase with cupredoxin domain
MKKTVLLKLGALAAMGLLLAGCGTPPPAPESGVNAGTNAVSPAASSKIRLVDGNNAIDDVMPDQIVDLTKDASPTKTITMTSFYGAIGEGKKFPQFSIKEITVKKGDAVQLNVTNTVGNHNLNIDEFNVHIETPKDVQVVAKFTANKSGRFIYYCSMPNHRAGGHWGVLNVQ